jgi:hypothetical protein
MYICNCARVCNEMIGRLNESDNVCIIIIIGMNVVDNINCVKVINKPCVCSRTMRLSTFCGLRRDQEQTLYFNKKCCQDSP